MSNKGISHFIYIKLMGVCAIIDGIIMLTLGSHFAGLQFWLAYKYMRYQAFKARKADNNVR